VCECGDPECDTTVRVTLPSYESVRRDSMLFLIAPGHQAADVEDVVDNGDGYLVVRKHEDTRAIVESTDRRHDRS
jgi:hypothetical protein